MMNLSDLLKEHLVKKVEPDPEKAQNLVSVAQKDLKAAKDNLKGGNPDWALAIAYNAMLSAGRALMAAKGYAPSSDAHHVAVVKFCAAVMPDESGGLGRLFDNYRVRRHDVMYGEAIGSVGDDEARRAIENAEKLVQRIKEKLMKK
jgi:uncharacterized protein (UPF0332 family)